MSKTFFIVLFFLGITFNAVRAQEFLKGRLIDAKEGGAVPFATIQIKSKAIGVISNDDGSFKIPIRFKTLGDTLEISSLGYQRKFFLLSQMFPDSVARIKMEPAVESLKEVVVYGGVRRFSANKIVEMALASIYKNAPKSAFSYVGYYRDYQKKEETYLNLNEATIAVFDSGFAKNDFETTRSSIYHYQRNKDFERDSVAELPYDYRDYNKVILNASMASYGGNEFTILRIHDAIRNYNINSYSFVNTLESDFVENHEFELGKAVFLDKEPLYTILFTKNAVDHLVKGKLIISKAGFKIHKMEYKTYVKKTGELLFNVVVEYKENDDLMYPNYISFNNGFQIFEPARFRIKNYYLDFGMECFRIDLTSTPLRAEALNLRNYKFRYKGKKVRWKEVRLEGNSVLLYPKLPKHTRFTDIYLPQDGSKGNFQCVVKPIKDVEGNVLNHESIRKVRQYREFFVQQLEKEGRTPENIIFMLKNKPIFKEQPIFHQKEASRYWMNTPLQENGEVRS